MAGRWLEKGALKYFKKKMHSKHREEWAYYGIINGNSKILFWNYNGRRLVREKIQESLLGSQIQEMIPMLLSMKDTRYRLMLLLNQMVSLFMVQGQFMKVAAPSIINSKSIGEWNSLKIIAEKQKYTVTANDIIVISSFTGIDHLRVT